LKRLHWDGIDPGIIHLANSAAIASRPEKTLGGIWIPGAILYGPILVTIDPERPRPGGKRGWGGGGGGGIARLRPVMSSARHHQYSATYNCGRTGCSAMARNFCRRAPPTIRPCLSADNGDGIHAFSRPIRQLSSYAAFSPHSSASYSMGRHHDRTSTGARRRPRRL